MLPCSLLGIEILEGMYWICKPLLGVSMSFLPFLGYRHLWVSTPIALVQVKYECPDYSLGGLCGSGCMSVDKGSPVS